MPFGRSPLGSDGLGTVLWYAITLATGLTLVTRAAETFNGRDAVLAGGGAATQQQSPRIVPPHHTKPRRADGKPPACVHVAKVCHSRHDNVVWCGRGLSFCHPSIPRRPRGLANRPQELLTDGATGRGRPLGEMFKRKAQASSPMLVPEENMTRHSAL